MRTWSGVMAFTDDLWPIVGPVPGVPGYFTCVVSTGFTLGPLMARRLAGHLAARPGAPSPIPPTHLPDRPVAVAKP